MQKRNFLLKKQFKNLKKKIKDQFVLAEYLVIQIITKIKALLCLLYSTRLKIIKNLKKGEANLLVCYWFHGSILRKSTRLKFNNLYRGPPSHLNLVVLLQYEGTGSARSARDPKEISQINIIQVSAAARAVVLAACARAPVPCSPSLLLVSMHR